LCERFRRWTDSLKIHEGGKGRGERGGKGTRKQNPTQGIHEQNNVCVMKDFGHLFFFIPHKL